MESSNERFETQIGAPSLNAPCPRTALYRVGERVEDESRVRLRVPEESHGHGAHGDAAGEVGGAVDGVDDPHPFRILQGGLVALLAHECGSREQAQELLLQESLVLDVGGCHQVLAGALGLNGEIMVVPDPASRFPDDLLEFPEVRCIRHVPGEDATLYY